MDTTPDPVQDWAGFWLREQNRYLQRWAQSRNEAPPEDLRTISLQAWQQGCELWLNNISAALPAEFVEPVARILQQSQDDLHRALRTAQARRQQAGQTDLPGLKAGDPALLLNSVQTLQEHDLSRLGQDPVWREFAGTFNSFVQFHIDFAIKSLETLKAQLGERPDHDPGQYLEKHLQNTFNSYQAQLQSTEYTQLLERLINDLMALPTVSK